MLLWISSVPSMNLSLREFVCFKQLRGEGQSLSQLDLLNLAGQLRVLQIETTRLRNHQSLPLTTPRSTLPPILHVSDRHSMDLYWDKALLLEGVITFIRVGLEMQDTVVVLATKTLREAIASTLQPEELARRTLFFFDAEELLSRFLINGWPDESRFREAMPTGLMQSKNSRVRIFRDDLPSLDSSRARGGHMPRGTLQ